MIEININREIKRKTFNLICMIWLKKIKNKIIFVTIGLFDRAKSY